MGLEAREMWGSVLPVTPVFVLTNGNRRLVEAFDQELQVAVFDLARDLVELARTMGRAIDVQVETGRWLRVRPDGTMSPTAMPASLTRVEEVRRKRARRLARWARLEALRGLLRIRSRGRTQPWPPPWPKNRPAPSETTVKHQRKMPRHCQPGRVGRFVLPLLVGGQGAPGGRRRGRVRTISTASTP